MTADRPPPSWVNTSLQCQLLQKILKNDSEAKKKKREGVEPAVRILVFETCLKQLALMGDWLRWVWKILACVHM